MFLSTSRTAIPMATPAMMSALSSIRLMMLWRQPLIFCKERGVKTDVSGEDQTEDVPEREATCCRTEFVAWVMVHVDVVLQHCSGKNALLLTKGDSVKSV